MISLRASFVRTEEGLPFDGSGRKERPLLRLCHKEKRPAVFDIATKGPFLSVRANKGLFSLVYWTNKYLECNLVLQGSGGLKVEISFKIQDWSYSGFSS